jgi:hypothetical protein
MQETYFIKKRPVSMCMQGRVMVLSRRKPVLLSDSCGVVGICQSRFSVRIPNRQTFGTDCELDIFITALVCAMIEE